MKTTYTPEWFAMMSQQFERAKLEAAKPRPLVPGIAWRLLGTGLAGWAFVAMLENHADFLGLVAVGVGWGWFTLTSWLTDRNRRWLLSLDAMATTATMQRKQFEASLGRLQEMALDPSLPRDYYITGAKRRPQHKAALTGGAIRSFRHYEPLQ